MSKYKYLIFDVDDTLLNFYAAFKSAQTAIAQKLNIPYSKEYMELDEKCGWKAWKESDLDNTNSLDIQKNYHTYYYQYIRNHYIYLLQELQLSANVDELVDCYLETVTASKVLMEENTLQVYETLSRHYRLALATNGVNPMQTERVSAFLPFTHKLYVSESMGYIKPTKEFFLHIIQDLSCKPAECLMIGDSMTNDIRGAAAIGMDTCYYNPRGKEVPEDVRIRYEIHRIGELVEILT